VVDVRFAPFALVRVTFTIVFCAYAFRLIQAIVLGLALTSWESSQAVKFAATVRLAEEIVPDIWSIGTGAAICFRAWARMITWGEWP
jgi:ABC-type arginine transport system permease subunit